MPKKLFYPTKDRVIDSGAVVYWSRLQPSQRNGWNVPVSCPNPLHQERLVRASFALKPSFDGLDRQCYIQAPPWKLSGELELPRGTKALLHKRAPTDVKLVAIECRGCFEETRELKFYPLIRLWRYMQGLMGVRVLIGSAYGSEKRFWCDIWRHLEKLHNAFWDELCSDCISKRGSYKKFFGERTAPSGTKIVIPEDINAEALVIYERCQHVRKTTRRDAMINWRTYGNKCPDCRRDPDAYHTRRIELASVSSVNGTEQKIREKVKRGRGRALGDKQLNPEDIRADLETVILKLSKNLPEHKIKRSLIAAEFHKKGERIDASTVTKRVQMVYGKGVSVADVVARVLSIRV